MTALFRSGACLVTAALRLIMILRGRTMTLPGAAVAGERAWPKAAEPNARTSDIVTS